MLPKAEGAASVIHADAKLAVREALHGLPDGHVEIVAIATETARSLFLAGTYREASARLTALTWGAEDLSADLGAEANRDAQGDFLDPYRLARALCLAAAAAAEVVALDTVYVDFRNEAGLRRECEEAHRDGFQGKMAIHPAQVATINDVFTPKPEAIAKAKAIVAAFAAQPGAGVVGIGGVMYDRPHLAKALRLLARAEAAGVATANWGSSANNRFEFRPLSACGALAEGQGRNSTAQTRYEGRYKLGRYPTSLDRVDGRQVKVARKEDFRCPLRNLSNERAHSECCPEYDTGNWSISGSVPSLWHMPGHTFYEWRKRRRRQYGGMVCGSFARSRYIVRIGPKAAISRKRSFRCAGASHIWDRASCGWSWSVRLPRPAGRQLRRSVISSSGPG